MLKLRSHHDSRLVAFRRLAERLVVPDDLVHRERHVLLDLVANDLVELLGVANGRNLGEAREDRLSVQRNDDRGGLDSALAHYRVYRRRQDGLHCAGSVGIDRRKRSHAVFHQRELALAADGVLRQHGLGRAHVESKKAVSHYISTIS